MTCDPQELRRIGGAPDLPAEDGIGGSADGYHIGEVTECADCHRDESECICNGPPLVEPMPEHYPRVYLSEQLHDDLRGSRNALEDCLDIAKASEKWIRERLIQSKPGGYWTEVCSKIAGATEPIRIWPVEGGGVVACYASESAAYSTDIDLSDDSDLTAVTRYGYLGCQIVRKYHTIQGENQPDEWTWSHPDYDGESSRLCGYGRTETDCEAQIDELINDLIHERCQDAIDEVQLAAASHAEVSGLVAIVNCAVARAFRDGLTFGSAK